MAMPQTPKYFTQLIFINFHFVTVTNRMFQIDISSLMLGNEAETSYGKSFGLEQGDYKAWRATH